MPNTRGISNTTVITQSNVQVERTLIIYSRQIVTEMCTMQVKCKCFIRNLET